MATKIVTKNSSTASAVPTASDLVQGELAVNVADKRLFTEDNAGAIVELGTNPSTLTVAGNLSADGGTIKLDGNYPNGVNNVALGNAALAANTTGTRNTAVGALAGDANTEGNYNSAFGYNSLGANTTGTHNTALGDFSQAANTTGTKNVSVGQGSFITNTTGSNNVVLGTEAMTANTTASNNTAVGFQSLYANTSGAENVAVGALALDANTTATRNVAVGFSAMGANTTGVQNVAVGYVASALNTTGQDNVAMGDYALYTNTTSSNNTAMGQGALYANTASNNTAVGKGSLTANTTGENNTAVGYQAADTITTGVGNTIIGGHCDVSAVDAAFAHALGYNLSCAAGYTTLGTSASDIRAAHGVATWATVSDERYKKDIVDSTTGLSFINALRPRTFKYRTLGELPETFNAYEEGSTEVFKSSQTQHGFIAQEIKAAIDADDSIKDGFKLWDDREDGSQEVAEAALIPILVKAIQELTARIETLEG